MAKRRGKISQPARNRAPNASQTFLLVWKRFGVKGSDICHEHCFHPSRRWRFDIAFPSQKLAVEFEGRGRHQTVVGFRNDCEKYNAAIELGWRVLRYPTSDLNAHVYDWITQINRVLCGVIPNAES